MLAVYHTGFISHINLDSIILDVKPNKWTIRSTKSNASYDKLQWRSTFLFTFRNFQTTF